jgi:hypothetical protein
MDEATFQRETARNRAAYDQLRETIRRDHAGRYAALGEGRILVSSADYHEAEAAVQQLRPVPEFYLIFPAETEPPFEPYCAYYTEPYLPP